MSPLTQIQVLIESLGFAITVIINLEAIVLAVNPATAVQIMPEPIAAQVPTSRAMVRVPV